MNKNIWAAMLRSVWFWWIFTTIIYVVLDVMLIASKTPGTPLAYITGFVGLFVPFGLLSLGLFFSPFSWVAFIVFVILMIWFSLGSNKWNLSLEKRILLVLLVLLALTTLIDLIRLTPFYSWLFFFNGEMSIRGPLF